MKRVGGEQGCIVIITIWWLLYDLLMLKFLGSFPSVSVNIFQIMFALTFALGPPALHYAFWSYPIHPGLGEIFLQEAGIDLIPILYFLFFSFYTEKFPLELQNNLCSPWSQPLAPSVTIAPPHILPATSPLWAETILFIQYRPYLALGLTDSRYSVNGFQCLIEPTVLLKQ